MPFNKNHLPSAGVLVVSAFGILFSLALAGILAIAGLFLMLTDPDDMGVIFSAISFAWENGLVAVLALPAAIFSLYRLLDRPLQLPSLPRWFDATRALIIWPLALGAGFLIARFTSLSWLFLPPMQILAIAIPIWWLVSISGRGLEGGRSSTRWKLFSVSLLVGNPLIFVVELLAVAPLAVLWVYSQPEFINLINEITGKMNTANLSPEILQEFARELISYPGLLSALIIGACCLAPLIEESLKTLAVWLLFGKELTPARGFVMGVLCGAAFTLVESLGVINQPMEGEAWVAVMIGRLGTAVMHILTAGLTGWGIASLASVRKFGRAFLGYAAAIGLHGLWNFVVIITAIQPFIDFSSPENQFFEMVGAVGFYLTAALAGLYFLGLFMANKRLRTTGLQEHVSEVK